MTTRRINSHANTDALVFGMLRGCRSPITAAELARLCSVSSSTMTRVLQRLEQEGKIKRTRRTRTSSYLEIV